MVDLSPQLIQIIAAEFRDNPHPRAIFAPDDTLLICNSAYGIAYDQSPESLVGQHWQQIIDHALASPNSLVIQTPDRHHWLAQAKQRRRQQASLSYDINLTDGRWFVCQEQLLDDGHLVLTSQEITRQKQTEFKLLETMGKLEYLASRDSLTSLLNRRYFLEILSQEYERSQRDKNSLTLLALDIDHFKAVNDTYGHNGGDVVLKLFSARLLTHLRNYDTAARIGGEEFAVLLPNTTEDQGKRIAERIRMGIENIVVPGFDQDFSITTSIGGVSTQDYIGSPEQLMAEADKALYQSKGAGRNQWAWCNQPSQSMIG